jgi:glycosyltransferase involved in cell wall biosynthesis
VKRILCITSNFPRWEGDSTTPFVLHLAQDLTALGWELEVLAPHAPGAALQGRQDGIAVERFRYLWPERAQSVCYGGGALVNLRRSPLNRLKLPALVAAELAAVSARVRSRPYDLVHSHWILPQGLAGLLATRKRPIPHVVTAHGSDVFALKGALTTRLKRAVLANADAVTVNSSFTEAGVRRIAPSIRRLESIPMGVDTRPLTSTQRQRATELRAAHRVGAGPLVLFLGRLVEEKGVADLLAALAMLGEQLPDTRALVVGEGQDRAALERLSADLGLAARVHFAGWAEPAEVPAYLAAADCLVGPSRRARDGTEEAQGLVYAEAMAAGTPVIATGIGGIPDTVIDGETGLLVPERAPAEIAAAVRRLSTDRGLALRLASRAGDRVRLHFSRRASAAAFSRLFESLIEGAGRQDA